MQEQICRTSAQATAWRGSSCNRQESIRPRVRVKRLVVAAMLICPTLPSACHSGEFQLFQRIGHVHKALQARFLIRSQQESRTFVQPFQLAAHSLRGNGLARVVDHAFRVNFYHFRSVSGVSPALAEGLQQIHRNTSRGDKAGGVQQIVRKTSMMSMKGIMFSLSMGFSSITSLIAG